MPAPQTGSRLQGCFDSDDGGQRWAAVVADTLRIQHVIAHPQVKVAPVLAGINAIKGTLHRNRCDGILNRRGVWQIVSWSSPNLSHFDPNVRPGGGRRRNHRVQKIGGGGC